MKKYSEIHEILQGELEAGKYAVGSRFPSEYELGIRFEASRLTANKAVNQLVAEGWLERGVRGAGTRVRLRQKNYKGLILYIGGLVQSTPNLSLDGLYSQAFQRGYYVTVASPPDTALNSFLATATASRLFAGIVPADYFWFDDQCPGLPVVYLGNYYASGDHTARHLVITDNEQVSHRLIEELLARGYRQPIIYADYSYKLTERNARVQGMLRALKERGIPDWDKRLFIAANRNDFTKADADAQLRKILHDFPNADAIVSVSDHLALRMYEALQEIGFSVPGKILLTGFGNYDFVSGLYHFPSVEQHLYQIGVAGADMLLDIVEGKAKADEPHLQVVPAELVNLEYIPRR